MLQQNNNLEFRELINQIFFLKTRWETIQSLGGEVEEVVFPSPSIEKQINHMKLNMGLSKFRLNIGLLGQEVRLMTFSPVRLRGPRTPSQH